MFDVLPPELAGKLQESSLILMSRQIYQLQCRALEMRLYNGLLIVVDSSWRGSLYCLCLHLISREYSVFSCLTCMIIKWYFTCSCSKEQLQAVLH